MRSEDTLLAAGEQPGAGAPPVLYEHAAAAAILRLDRPDRRNALTAELREALVAAIERANRDPRVEGIVIAANGRAFCAGGDLSTMGALSEEAARARIAAAHALPRAVHGSAKPVVAAVEGACAGAGLALASLCDLVVAGPSARFVTAFEKVALMPDLGALWSVSRRMGPQAARRLFLLGGDLDATQASKAGLCDVLVAEGEAEARAVDLVLDLARNAPATRDAVRAFFADPPATLDEALAVEAATQPRLYRSHDLAEGIAAFREKRSPRWRGR